MVEGGRLEWLDLYPVVPEQLLELADVAHQVAFLALELLHVAPAFGAARHAVGDEAFEILARAVGAAFGKGIASDLAYLGRSDMRISGQQEGRGDARTCVRIKVRRDGMERLEESVRIDVRGTLRRVERRGVRCEEKRLGVPCTGRMPVPSACTIEACS